MNHIRQINLLIKRILCRPATIVVLLVIPAVLIAVSLLPARKQSTEIVSGVYIESSDEHTDAFLSYLTSTSTGFTFRHYESLKDMKDDVASGRIDSAYMVPDGFSESMLHSDGKRHITVYTTDGSSFQSVSEESVYAALHRADGLHGGMDQDGLVACQPHRGKVVLEVSLCVCHVVSPFRAFCLYPVYRLLCGKASTHAKKANTLLYLPETSRYLRGVCPCSFFSKILYTAYHLAALPRNKHSALQL